MNRCNIHQMLSNFRKVCEFNLCAGHAVNDTEQKDILSNNMNTVKLRYDLIAEEITELFELGFNKNNFTEVIDALCDILYVVYGAGAVFGINLDELYDESFDESYQCEKLSTKEILEANKEFITCVRYHLQYLLERLHDALFKTSNHERAFDNIKYLLTEIIALVYRIGYKFNIKLDETFALVHESNMSKFCATEVEAQETVDNYKSDLRYKSPAYRLSTDKVHFVVYNADTGKILKSKYYHPVDFTNYIDENFVHDTD